MLPELGLKKYSVVAFYKTKRGVRRREAEVRRYSPSQAASAFLNCNNKMDVVEILVDGEIINIPPRRKIKYVKKQRDEIDQDIIYDIAYRVATNAINQKMNDEQLRKYINEVISEY
jgi:hypothetical protein